MRVGSLVSGSFQSSNGKLQIPIELLDVRSGKQIWGQTYQGTTSDLADIQHEIATDVAYHLKIQLGEETTARLNRRYSTNPAAYNAYLKGRAQLDKRTPDSLREAVDDFQKSLTSDPNYAPTLTGLADCYSLLAFYGLEPSGPLLKNALKTSQEALQLDSTSAEAYTSRAFARTLLNFDWEGAEADYKRAIELNPSYPQAHAWYALTLLTPQGREAEARAQMNYVQAADPDSPLTIIGEAMIERYSGRTEQSIRVLEPHVRGPDPYEPSLELLSEDYLQMRKVKRAMDILHSGPAVLNGSDSRDAIRAIAYANTGQTAKANETVERLAEKVHAGEPLAYQAAEIYTALGDHEKAMEMLQIAFNRKEPELLFLNVNPFLAPLRSEKPFQLLLQQMNLQ